MMIIALAFCSVFFLFDIAVIIAAASEQEDVAVGAAALNLAPLMIAIIALAMHL